MSLRMPIDPPEGFGPRPSMSFFMYNQDGQQAIARPYLDGPPAAGPLGPSPLDDLQPHAQVSPAGQLGRRHQCAQQQLHLRFQSVSLSRLRQLGRSLLAHGRRRGQVGSREALVEAFLQGREIKVGIRGLCADLAEDSNAATPDHTVFVQTGPGYYCTDRKLFCAGTQPVIRVRPAIPMRYTSGGWDFGWLMPRSDGFVACWLCDPYTLRFRKKFRPPCHPLVRSIGRGGQSTSKTDRPCSIPKRACIVPENRVI